MDRYTGAASWKRPLGVAIAAYLLVTIALGVYWSDEPSLWDVESFVKLDVEALGAEPRTGFATSSTLIRLAETLLEKPGGYISNDIAPPGLWMDNMPNWEFGVLVQIRDMSRALRKDIARAQSTSQEDKSLGSAEPLFNFDNGSFMFPSTEGEYKRGLKFLRTYQKRLLEGDARFYARADNLRNWLADVETRIGSLSQQLSASVGRNQLELDLAGQPPGAVDADTPEESLVKTPYLEIDDVFYESRGAAYALVHLMKAIEIDFADVLRKKNATVSLRQIVRELEASQQTVFSPLILNGGGFGLFANHSLVMANYLSRANAAIIDLRRLLEQG